jgi:hypothetical protein
VQFFLLKRTSGPGFSGCGFESSSSISKAHGPGSGTLFYKFKNL